jgi:choline-glycine betaine transporter
MFGSCCDILLTIQDDCQSAVYGDTVSIFCQRTQIGAVIGFLGMASGFLAAIARYLNHSPSKDVLYTELLLSIFLTVMFAVSLGLITGIGGPGQAVGDLYYGSWLAFFAAMGATTGLYQEIKDAKEKIEFFDWKVGSNNKNTVIDFPVTDFQKM